MKCKGPGFIFDSLCHELWVQDWLWIISLEGLEVIETPTSTQMLVMFPFAFSHGHPFFAHTRVPFVDIKRESKPAVQPWTWRSTELLNDRTCLDAKRSSDWDKPKTWDQKMTMQKLTKTQLNLSTSNFESLICCPLTSHTPPSCFRNLKFNHLWWLNQQQIVYGFFSRVICCNKINALLGF